jgi:dolichol-phosphate mannosyltransferase
VADAQGSSLLSLIVPVHDEEAALATFMESCSAELDKIPIPHEVIFVDDGSVDGTWEVLRRLCDAYPSVRLIRFSRNFGKESAILAGLERCRGDAAIIMDADLQHPPALLSSMVEIWREQGVDIVDGVKDRDHSAGVFERLSSSFFNWVFQRTTGFDMVGASDYKLLSRRVIDTLCELKDYNLFFRGTTLWMGYSHQVLPYQVEERREGISKWGVMSRLRLAITAITSFTSLPLHLMTLVGIVSFLFAVILGLQTFYNYLNGAAVEGFTTVILLLLMFGSMITLGLGIIGAYLSKIHDEVRGRPRYLIDETYRVGPPDDQQNSDG